mmetsp:Transcript_29371/g.72509  ORF Transcript_29371/g.72509 Transcript_29371/m.72509 type:complete len:528 (-) Transcript_29371:88-1671(-)
MASFIASSVQAMASGMSAMADKQQNDLQAQWRLETITHREYCLRWRTEDMYFMELEKEWRETDNKRHAVDEKSKQVTLMAELCALLAGFQMMMFYETELQAVSEYWYSTVLLSIWGIMCVSVSCLYITVMVVAGMINFSVLQVSAHEGCGQLRASLERELYTLNGGKPDGFVISANQFLHLWQAQFDDRFRQLVRAFSVGIPIFMSNLAVTIVVKFDMSPPAAWIGFGGAMFGVFLWWRSHSAIISYLLWRAPPGAASKSPQPTPVRESESGNRSKLSFIREDDEDASEASPGKEPAAARRPYLGAQGDGDTTLAAHSRARRSSEQRVLQSPPAAPMASRSAPVTPLGSDSQAPALESLRAWWRASPPTHSPDDSAGAVARRLDRAGSQRSWLRGASPARSNRSGQTQSMAGGRASDAHDTLRRAASLKSSSGDAASANALWILERECSIGSNSSGILRRDSHISVARKEDAREPSPVHASQSSGEHGAEERSNGGWWLWRASSQTPDVSAGARQGQPSAVATLPGD